jgi:FAD:protein FMN transferase
MATAWTICLIDPNKTTDELEAAIEEGMEEVRRIDRWMSEWKPESLVSQINSNAGIKPVKVTDEAWEVISESLKQSELTDGAFDITFNAFFGLYGWKAGNEKFPTDKEIKDRLPLVNYKNVKLDRTKKTVFLARKGMKIGLGGMGQGWAVDKVLEILKPRKIKAGYVDGSGDTYFWGRKPDAKLWTVGIGHPRPQEALNPPMELKDRDVVYKLYLTNQAVTTAGDTEHFFIRNGKRFHHIIDPRTGRSADKSIQVTTLCKKAAVCDAADDGIFILGPTKGIRYAEKLGIEAVIIDPALKIHLTKGLKPIKTQWGPALELPGAPAGLNDPEKD